MDIIQSFTDRNKRHSINKGTHARTLEEKYPNIDAGYVIENNISTADLDREFQISPQAEASPYSTGPNTGPPSRNFESALQTQQNRAVAEGDLSKPPPPPPARPANAGDAVIQEASLYSDTPAGADFAAASRRIYETMFGSSETGAAYRAIALGPISTNRQKPETDEDFAKFGVEFMGQFNYNITKMGVDVAKLQGLDQGSKLAFYALMEYYDKLPDFTWKGTGRFFSGILSDPTSAVGLGTLGYGFLGRSAAKQSGKEGLKLFLKNSLANTGLVGAIEGGAYGAVDEYFRQEVGVEAKVRENFNVAEIAKMGGMGVVFGGVLGYGLPKFLDLFKVTSPEAPDIPDNTLALIEEARQADPNNPGTLSPQMQEAFQGWTQRDSDQTPSRFTSLFQRWDDQARQTTGMSEEGALLNEVGQLATDAVEVNPGALTEGFVPPPPQATSATTLYSNPIVPVFEALQKAFKSKDENTDIVATVKKAVKKQLSDVEINAIIKDATNNDVVDTDLVARAAAEVVRVKKEFPKSDGWLPIEVNAGGTAPSFKIKKNGAIEVKWSQPSYGFHKPKNANVKRPVHKKRLVKKTVSDVEAVLLRAKNGDQAAIDIIAQSNWYKDMRTRLRTEFGGMADVFADLLGATSAQTGVQQNYTNGLAVLRRFTKGEYDAEIAVYAQHLADGKPRGPALFARDKDGNDPFRLIRSASGAMFGANSPAATEALLDMFRQVKKGASPKTINFTGNLIGYGTDATIDVWAGRYLRDAAGLPRIPPPAEKAVAGAHLTGTTFDNPKIGSEFGFGQEVFAEAAEALNRAGGIAAYDPSLSKLGPDDLQAIVWFLEKEKWTKNGWTSKAGEGGSLDYESTFGGSPNRPRVAELRSIINAKDSKPADVTAAQAELKTLEGEPQRYVAGVSMERPGKVPTNVQQLQLADEVTAPLKTDDKVMALQANSSIGGFAGDRERNLNFEFVTQTDFNKDAVTRSLVEAGRKYDQDAVFLSKVVPDDTPDARPGVEVYFKERQGVDYAEEILAILQAKGVDGFTFVTDNRQGDRALTQAATDEATGGLVGIRFQYIPEFDGDFDIARAAEIFAEKEDLFIDVMDEVGKIEGITYADVVKYQTDVYKNNDRTGSEWITGGIDYGTYLGAVPGKVPGGG